MAVPTHITTRNLSGVYTMNKQLSDSSQQTLKMQNVGWLVRQAVQYSNIEVTLKQYTTPAEGDKPEVEHLDQYQVSTGGMGNSEERIMDWQTGVIKNKIWGEVRGRSRYATLDQIEEAWLTEGWDETCTGQGEIVEGYVESVKDGWTAYQIWGFAVVEGQRRHVRRILAKRKGWKDEKVRMVYDWKGPVEEAQT